MPKSLTFTSPAAVSSTFSGLISRCTTPCAWATSKAWPNCSMIVTTCASGNGPARSNLRSDPLATYSITR